jgi:hypothetical protein
MVVHDHISPGDELLLRSMIMVVEPLYDESRKCDYWNLRVVKQYFF